MMTSLLFSQRLSSDTVRCVPVSSLRNALIVKAKYDQCQEVVKNCRDSITILNKLVLTQDSSIEIKTKEIVLLKTNQTLYSGTIKEKDEMIETYKKKYLKEKKLKIFGFSIGGLGILLGLFVL